MCLWDSLIQSLSSTNLWTRCIRNYFFVVVCVCVYVCVCVCVLTNNDLASKDIPFKDRVTQRSIPRTWVSPSPTRPRPLWPLCKKTHSYQMSEESAVHTLCKHRMSILSHNAVWVIQPNWASSTRHRFFPCWDLPASSSSLGQKLENLLTNLPITFDL